VKVHICNKRVSKYTNSVHLKFINIRPLNLGKPHLKYGSSAPLFISIQVWKPPENRKTPKTPPSASVPPEAQHILKECHATEDRKKQRSKVSWVRNLHSNQVPN
jgi:hypothetical protein